MSARSFNWSRNRNARKAMRLEAWKSMVKNSAMVGICVVTFQLSLQLNRLSNQSRLRNQAPTSGRNQGSPE